MNMTASWENGTISGYGHDMMNTTATATVNEPRYSETYIQSVLFILNITDYIGKIVPPMWLVIGGIGNVLSIIVITRKKMWVLPLSPWLVVLAFSDICVLYTGLLKEWVLVLTKIDYGLISNFSCKFLPFLTYTTVQYSAWLLTCISVERLISVVWPFKAKLVCTRKNSVITMVILFLLLSALNSHFLVGLELIEYPGYGVICDMQIGSDYDHFFLSIWSWIDFTIASALPFSIIITCNILILINVKRSQRKFRSGGDGGLGGVHEAARARQERMLTVLMVVLSATFIITTLPMRIYLLGYNAFGWRFSSIAHEIAVLTLWWAIVNMFMYLNNTINFALYVLSAPVFRNELKGLFKRSSDAQHAR